MGRKKITDDPYAQAVKKERKKRTIKAKIDVVYEGGFKPGNIVVVEQKTTILGKFIGAVIEPQKWCDGGIPVAIQHDVFKLLCIRTENGDTIVKATK